MTEADYKLRLRLRSATVTLARQAASKAVKAAYRRQGVKVCQIPHRDIVAAAEHYFLKHRAELLADAAEVVDCWQREGFFGKKAQRSYVSIREATSDCATLESNAQNAEA